MGGNCFGKVYKFMTFGESHGEAVGVVIDGCPPGIKLLNEHISTWTDRRRPGQTPVASYRKERDFFEIVSGRSANDDYTYGTPIAVIIRNEDKKSTHYAHLQGKFRPSHADYTVFKKYRYMDWAGGGRASGRETVGRVIAGAVAFRILKKLCPDLITSCYVQQIGDVKLETEPKIYDHNKIYSYGNPARCPDTSIAKKMIEIIEKAKAANNSIGSAIQFVINKSPIGLGEPVFDKLHADIAKALMSLPAVKGIEIGSGFKCIQMSGKDHNDEFIVENNEIRTKTNNAGGMLGGISNGEMIYGRVAFKAPSSIDTTQHSVDSGGKSVEFEIGGRHDPCIGPRAVSVVECSLANVILDHVLRNYAVQCAKEEFNKFNISREIENYDAKNV